MIRLPILAALLAPLTAIAADWPQWRGPDRDGVCKETGLLQSWPGDGPKLLWKKESLGSGYASLAVSRRKLYTMADRGNEAFVVCLDRDGEQRWATPIGKAWKDGGSRRTPTVGDGRLFALTGHGELACLALDGKVLWRKSFKDDFGGKMMSGWGYCESPTLDGDTLVVTPGGDQAAVVALEPESGAVKWKAAVPGCGGAGYTGVAVGKFGSQGKQYVALFGKGGGCVGINAANGTLLWRHNKVAGGTANVSTPILDGDLALYSTGYGDGGSACLKVSAQGDSATAEEVYVKGAKELRNHHGGMVLANGYVYGGHGQNDGYPFCLDLKTGAEKWQRVRGPGSGSAAALFADGRLYLRYENGVMALLDPNPNEQFAVVGKFSAPRSGAPAWAHPVIADGVLYLRDQKLLMAYDVKAR